MNRKSNLNHKINNELANVFRSHPKILQNYCRMFLVIVTNTYFRFVPFKYHM